MEADVRGKVLCVEDNMDDCELVREILRDLDVTCVPSISEAREHLEKQEYELILIDEHLPDGSGLTLCGQINNKNLNTPVLILTGDAYLTSAQAVRCGAKALLTKSKVDYVEDLLLFAGRYAGSATA